MLWAVLGVRAQATGEKQSLKGENRSVKYMTLRLGLFIPLFYTYVKLRAISH